MSARKLCRIQAFDQGGLSVMDVFAELSDKELRGTAIYLEEMVIRNLLRAYRAELYQERRQMHIQALLMPALFSELEYLAKIMNMVNRPGMGGAHDGPGPKDWSPIDELTREIAEEIARTFFIYAWGDAQVERGRGIYGVAPEPPEYVFPKGMSLVRSMERLNRMPLRKMYELALKKAGLSDAVKYRNEFAFLTAMEAMSTGVRWSDDYRDHGLKVPYAKFTQSDLKEEDIEKEG